MAVVDGYVFPGKSLEGENVENVTLSSKGCEPRAFYSHKCDA